MKKNKNLGIWMDHSTADLIDVNAIGENHSIESKFDFQTKEEALNKSESNMHNKRQQLQEDYYKEIAIEILKYDNVLLFGPTNAKVELHNYLKKDSHFNDINIAVEPEDKMTDNEKQALVTKYFKNI